MSSFFYMPYPSKRSLSMPINSLNPLKHITYLAGTNATPAANIDWTIFRFIFKMVNADNETLRDPLSPGWDNHSMHECPIWRAKHQYLILKRGAGGITESANVSWIISYHGLHLLQEHPYNYSMLFICVWMLSSLCDKRSVSILD